MSDLVLHETRGAVALLTLNRPEKLNALSYALVDRVIEILDSIEDDDATRAVIRGQGRVGLGALDVVGMERPPLARPEPGLRVFDDPGDGRSRALFAPGDWKKGLVTCLVEQHPRPLTTARGLQPCRPAEERARLRRPES